MEAFVKGVDDMVRCSAGCYLKNKLEDYRGDAESFANVEGVDYERLREFLLLFGDIKLNVVVDLDFMLYGRSARGSQPPTAKSMIEEKYAGALEMLNCLEDTKKNVLFGIIVKCALYYARVSSAVIPKSLQLI